MRRRELLAISAASVLLVPGLQAHAAEEAPFDHKSFDAARTAGKPILVEIDASWCPTCARQRPILAKLMSDPAFKDLMIFKVNFDTQKQVVREMGANMQSTLIVFHGEKEKGRSVGDTDPASIRALLERAAA